ncbi:hypothetical protein SEA_ANGELIQUE_71 [Gordonia phage Angelique]|nr:hypothetical protein SEA_ANGELIQUE_71 [Gordonia phage Angelique]
MTRMALYGSGYRFLGTVDDAEMSADGTLTVDLDSHPEQRKLARLNPNVERITLWGRADGLWICKFISFTEVKHWDGSVFLGRISATFVPDTIGAPA